VFSLSDRVIATPHYFNSTGNTRPLLIGGNFRPRRTWRDAQTALLLNVFPSKEVITYGRRNDLQTQQIRANPNT
jgi:hypothetical protein